MSENRVRKKNKREFFYFRILLFLYKSYILCIYNFVNNSICGMWGFFIIFML